VGAAVLTEIHQQPPAGARCLHDVLAQIEEGIRKPRWNVDCVRRGFLRSRGRKERECDSEDDQPMAHGSPGHRRSTGSVQWVDARTRSRKKRIISLEASGPLLSV